MKEGLEVAGWERGRWSAWTFMKNGDWWGQSRAGVKEQQEGLPRTCRDRGEGQLTSRVMEDR
jgi:hypothetical protein